MKLKNKDQIITCLIDMLSIPIDKEGSLQQDYIHDGWIEALKWVLGLTDEEKEVFIEGRNTLVVKNKTTYTKEQVKEAVDIAIGDDGNKSNEVIAILKSEREDNAKNTTN